MYRYPSYGVKNTPFASRKGIESSFAYRMLDFGTRNFGISLMIFLTGKLCNSREGSINFGFSGTLYPENPDTRSGQHSPVAGYGTMSSIALSLYRRLTSRLGPVFRIPNIT